MLGEEDCGEGGEFLAENCLQFLAALGD